MCLLNLSLRRSSHRGLLIVPCSYLKTRANHANEVSEKPFLAYQDDWFAFKKMTKTHFYKLAFRNYYGPQFIFFVCMKVCLLK